MSDNMEIFKQYQDNPSFKKWLFDLVFSLTYNKEGKPYEGVVLEEKTRYPKGTEHADSLAAEGKGGYGGKT